MFNRDKSNDSRRSNSRGGDFGRNRSNSRDRVKPQMHKAVCSDCGANCEVPFKPTTNKPIYCSKCFTNHGGSQTSNRSDRRSYDRPRSQDRRMFEAVCDKCNKRLY